MQTKLPRMLAVKDAAGEHLFWTNEDDAHRLLAKGQVRLIWSRRRVRHLEAVKEKLPRQRPVAGGSLGGWRTSHKGETADNPAGVWTLRPSHQLVLPGKGRS